MKVRTVAVVVTLGGAIACLDTFDSKESVAATRSELEACREAWVGLTPLQDMPGDAPEKLQWHDGSLYYVHAPYPSRFVSLPDTGGTPSEVSRDVTEPFWIEDGVVLYARWDRLFSVPLGGGSSTLVSSGERFDPDAPRENVLFLHEQLDASHMYWVMHRFAEPEWSVWRMPRDGGPSEQLGGLADGAQVPTALVVSSDVLLVSGRDGNLYRLPKQGGDAEALPPLNTAHDDVMLGDLLGAADSGVLWALGKKRAPNATRTTYDLELETPTGATKEIWPSMPASFIPDHAWPDAEGGWVIAGLETFSDDADHTSVWHIDAQANTKRLACDARVEPASGYATAAALTDDAAYLVVMYLRSDVHSSEEDEGGTGWKLIRVQL